MHVLLDAWTDFHETLPVDVVCIGKVYRPTCYCFSFSMSPKWSGGKNSRSWPFSGYHFHLMGYFRKKRMKLKI